MKLLNFILFGMIAIIGHKAYNQIPPNNIIIGFTNSVKLDKSMLEYGQITLEKNGKLLIVKEKFSSNNSQPLLEDNKISTRFNTRRNTIVFLSIKKNQEIMKIYFSMELNDAGYSYSFNQIKFEQGTFYVDLYARLGGIQKEYQNGSKKYYSKNNTLNIDSRFFKKFRISKKEITEDDILYAHQNKEHRKRKIKKILNVLYSEQHE